MARRAYPWLEICREKAGGSDQLRYLAPFASATQLVEDAIDEPCGLVRLGRDRRLLAVAERLENRLHFPVDREAAGLCLREDQRVIDQDVELTARARRDFGRLAKPPFE